jgi:hypothetical protein
MAFMDEGSDSKNEAGSSLLIRTGLLIQTERGLPSVALHCKQITFLVDRTAIAISFGGFKGYRFVADGT